MSTLTKPITAEELLAMGDIGRCELIYGELVMMSPAGANHGMVAMRVGAWLTTFVDEHALGICFAAETGFLIKRNPDLVRAPDASFVSKARAQALNKRGFFPGVPDLAAEVNSPDDTRREIEEKIDMWLAGGTAVVWELDPLRMSARIHRTGRAPQELLASDSIQDEPLLPGFVLPLSKVFKMP